VENFFQDFVANETPKMWLDRVLDAQPQDSPERTSLRDIFESTHCVPLFLPATSRAALRALDQIREADLTPEYVEGMEGLRAHIRDSLSDFQFYPKWVSGGHLATMLEALVHAANNNMMESVPSVWSLFVQKQVKGARESSEFMFKNHMQSLSGISPPLTDEEHSQAAKQAAAAAHQMFDDLLFGTAASASATAASQALQTTIDIESGRCDGENKRRVLEFCTHIGDAARQEFDRLVQEVDLPQQEKNLKAQLNQKAHDVLEAMQERIHQYDKTAKRLTSRVEGDIQLLLSRHVQVNTEMVQRVLQEAATAAGELHESELRAVLSQGGVGQGTMDAQHRAATRAARRAFKDQASSIAGEPSFQAYAALADQLMESNAAKLTAENKKLVKRECHRKRGDVLDMLHSQYESVKVRMPVEEKDLKALIRQHESMALASFGEALAAFKSFDVMKEARSDLKRDLSQARDQLAGINMHKWTQLVREPLQFSRALVRAAAPSYFLTMTLRIRAREFANEQIGNSLPSDLKYMVIERWLSTEEEHGIADILQTKMTVVNVVTTVVTCIAGLMGLRAFRVRMT